MDAPSSTAVRAEPLARRLARAASAIEALKERIDLLGWRDRNECRSLLQTLELRSQDTMRRFQSLFNNGVIPDKQWARLERSCIEIEEHLSFLAQTIRGRTTPRDRLPGDRTTPSRRESS